MRTNRVSVGINRLMRAHPPWKVYWVGAASRAALRVRLGSPDLPSEFRGSNIRREAAPECIFRDSARQDELQQVIGSARLGADARHLEAAERLAIRQRAGDFAIDVEIADTKLTLD